MHPQTKLAIHGGRPGDQQLFLDGLRFNNILGSAVGGAFTIYMNTGSVQEISVTTDNSSAEQETGGIRLNEPIVAMASTIVVVDSTRLLTRSRLRAAVQGQSAG